MELGSSAVAAAAAAPLADAIEKRDFATARAVITDSRINAVQADGMTALHWAAFHDDVGLARTLLAAGADAKAKNRYGVMPLSLACKNGSAEMIKLLLDAGADVNAPLPGKETPLMTAARTGRVEAVKLLISRGANLDATVAQEQTALMWAAADGHREVVEALIAAGADFRTPLDSGFTPMLFAVRAGHAEVVRALKQAGVDINDATDPEKAGARLLPKGSSALSLAIENGHFELAAWLLDEGADPNDMRGGYTPLHMITWVRKADRGESESGAPEPVGTGHLTSEQFIRKLVAKGANVNAGLTSGPSGGGRIARKASTPFMMAADTADAPLMRLLLELGADPNTPNSEGCTPLMAAAGLGTRTAEEEAGTEDEALEAIEFLLALGADPNAVSSNGDTAMHGAAFANFPRVVKLLAAKGAKIEVWNQPNKRGWTPQRIAEGHRFGNFKPSFETIDAIKEVMLANGVTPPPPIARENLKRYEAPN